MTLFINQVEDKIYCVLDKLEVLNKSKYKDKLHLKDFKIDISIINFKNNVLNKHSSINSNEIKIRINIRDFNNDSIIRLDHAHGIVHLDFEKLGIKHKISNDIDNNSTLCFLISNLFDKSKLYINKYYPNYIINSKNYTGTI